MKKILFFLLILATVNAGAQTQKIYAHSAWNINGKNYSVIDGTDSVMRINVTNIKIFKPIEIVVGSDANYDMFYRNSSGIFSRLANGTTGQVITATTSAAPTWTAPANIYNVDGSVSGHRKLDGSSSNFNLQLGDVDAAKQLGLFRVDANNTYFNSAVKVNYFGTSDANYTIGTTDYFIELPTATATRTLTLPTASANTGRMLIVRNKNSSGSAWQFSPAVKDGADASVTTIVNDTVYQLISNGTDWVIIN
jgi:hypothetical protein